MNTAIKVFLVIIFLLFIPFFNLLADNGGGGLVLSPAVGNYNTGQKFNVEIFASSENRAINAAEAMIVYPIDYLEIVSISKQNSIFIFWPEEPNFSNKDGVISFAGGLPSPGYTGKNGKILKIIFRAKKTGIAEIKFKGGMVLADDGVGTNLLSFFGNSKYDLRAPTSKKKVAVSPPSAPATTTEAAAEIKTAEGVIEKIPEREICKSISFAKIFFLSVIIGFLINLAIFSIICKFKERILKFYKKMQKKI